MSFLSRVGGGLHRLPRSMHAMLPPEQRADLRRWFGRYHPWGIGVRLHASIASAG